MKITLNQDAQLRVRFPANVEMDLPEDIVEYLKANFKVREQPPVKKKAVKAKAEVPEDS